MLLVLAEKDPHELEALRGALEAPDRDIVVVADGPNVVTLAIARNPDAVVIGSSVGRMGGFAVSRELKTRAEIGEVKSPVVLVLLERQADSWLAGWSRCDGYLVKPVDPLDVDDKLRELVGEGVTR